MTKTNKKMWNEFDKNEGVIKIKIPKMNEKEIIEKCFNK